LAGRGIVITRPAHQSADLAQRVTGAGGRVFPFPTIEIVEPENLAALDALIDRLDEFDLAIFASPNAVARAMASITARRALPAQLAIAAIGQASARALARYGVRGVIVPRHGFDSEALLALPALHDMRGKRVAIFRGTGGRELMAKTLAARGASVEYAECYRRVRAPSDPAPLIDARARGEVDAVVVTSSEGFRNFVEMLGERREEFVAATPIFVPHPRIAETARALGAATVIVTAPGDDGIFAGLCNHFSAREGR
jgi:uroporphyrinogen-III synthase